MKGSCGGGGGGANGTDPLCDSGWKIMGSLVYSELGDSMVGLSGLLLRDAARRLRDLRIRMMMKNTTRANANPPTTAPAMTGASDLCDVLPCDVLPGDVGTGVTDEDVFAGAEGVYLIMECKTLAMTARSL